MVATLVNIHKTGGVVAPEVGTNCKKESQRWCCTQNKYCRARLHVENNAIVAIFNHHNHEKKEGCKARFTIQGDDLTFIHSEHNHPPPGPPRAKKPAVPLIHIME
ncbi:hypothetical protein JYU34_004407 [Plutella xylostella]|uniref:Modifier of mdg4 n=1 Tax=Plutella xylostella TaxID=51655 RepID=A0ABQ7QXX2_PLUXY|nr:hypothetical protein JYU34_004407 [Plutella xylostella]